MPYSKRSQETFQEGLSNKPRDDARQRNTVDDLGTARCPLCGYRLVARLDRWGPYFFCLCRERRKAA